MIVAVLENIMIPKFEILPNNSNRTFCKSLLISNTKKYFAYNYFHYTTSNEFVNWNCPTSEAADLSGDQQAFIQIMNIEL